MNVKISRLAWLALAGALLGGCGDSSDDNLVCDPPLVVSDDGNSCVNPDPEPVTCEAPQIPNDDGTACVDPDPEPVTCEAPQIPNPDGTACIDPDMGENGCIDNPFGTTEIYARGGFNSWNALEAQKMNFLCNRFELVAEIDGDYPFKIADAGWSSTTDFGSGPAGDTLTTGVALPVVLQGSNLNYSFSGLQKLVLDVSSSATAPTLTINSCGEAPFSETLYVRGGFNSWGAGTDSALTWYCDAYFVNVEATGGYEFKIADAGWGATTSFGGDTPTTVTAGTATALTSDDAKGASTSNLSFTFDGAHTVKLSFDANGTPQLVISDEYFVDPGKQSVTDPIALSAAFDSRDLANKTPFGAVEAGTAINFSFTALPGISAASLVIEGRTLEGNQEVLEYSPLTEVAMTKAVDGDQERWSASYTFPNVLVYGYYFKFTIGEENYVLQNNKTSIYWTLEKGAGGEAMVAFEPADSTTIRRYRQTSYKPGFTVPEWSKDAVYYYIFPERFRNGDSSNDPAPGVDTYLDQAVEFHSNWMDRPYRPDSGDGSDANYNNDFFGGDLAGIIEKLDYLKELGVNTLYINPIFEAPSNHKYDTANYKLVDDNFGTNAQFQQLTAAATAKGIRIVLDTSLNHTGSDSSYFDRYGKYDGIGAFENGVIRQDSPFYTWYEFYPDGATPEEQYNGWVGVSTLPDLMESDSWRAYAYRDEDSVTKMWLDMGLSGWRMDVAPWVSDDFWREWRVAVKTHSPDAVTIAETWFDASKHLLGDQFDSTMNYIFRNATLEFANGGDAGAVYQNFELMRENYPQEAFYALMNLLSSHDAARSLHQFGYTDSNNSPAVMAEAKQRLLLAVLFQMSYPGAPAIFYGDEVGVTGGEDPYNRAPYPWADKGGNPDLELLQTFKQYIAMRSAHPVLRHGSLDAPVLTDANRIVLVRKHGASMAITAFSNADSALATSLLLPEFAGKTLTDAVDGSAVTVGVDGVVNFTIPALSGRILIAD